MEMVGTKLSESARRLKRKVDGGDEEILREFAFLRMQNAHGQKEKHRYAAKMSHVSKEFLDL